MNAREVLTVPGTIRSIGLTLRDCASAASTGSIIVQVETLEVSSVPIVMAAHKDRTSRGSGSGSSTCKWFPSVSESPDACQS